MKTLDAVTEVLQYMNSEKYKHMKQFKQFDICEELSINRYYQLNEEQHVIKQILDIAYPLLKLIIDNKDKEEFISDISWDMKAQKFIEYTISNSVPIHIIFFESDEYNLYMQVNVRDITKNEIIIEVNKAILDDKQTLYYSLIHELSHIRTQYSLLLFNPTDIPLNIAKNISNDLNTPLPLFKRFSYILYYMSPDELVAHLQATYKYVFDNYQQKDSETYKDVAAWMLESDKYSGISNYLSYITTILNMLADDKMSKLIICQLGYYLKKCKLINQNITKDFIILNKTTPGNNIDILIPEKVVNAITKEYNNYILKVRRIIYKAILDKKKEDKQ